MSKYLVLGSSGFIGTKIVESLSKHKVSLRLFDSVLFRKTELLNEDVEMIQGSFSKNCDFLSLTKDVDTVFHLISTSIPSSTITPATELEENVLTTLKLLEACVENKVKKIVFISSGGTVYGKSKGKPFKETDQTNPISSYGVQKLTIEKYLQLYYHLHGLDYRIVRLANPYGPGQNPHGSLGVVTKFVYQALHNQPITIFGEGNVVRDYIYIADAVDGILAITKYEGAEKLFNLGCDRGYSVKDIIQKIEQISGEKFTIHYQSPRKVDVDYSVLDTTRYMQISGVTQMTSVEEGIEQLITYFKKIKD